MKRFLDKRLYIVAGKGGVGKSTVSAALARAVASTGKRVCIVEVDTHERMSKLLGGEPGPRNEIVRMDDGIDALNLEGKASLEEYLLIVLKSKKLTNVIFDSKVYQYFATAAPGLKELMTIGKVMFILDGNPSKKIAPSHDVVILDAPATGHSVNFLQTPLAIRDMINVGLVARETQKIIDLLTDPARTCLNLVSLPEEMPVNETIELYEAMRDRVNIPAGMLFINGLYPRVLGDEDTFRAFERVVESNGRERPYSKAALAAARLSRLRRSLHLEYVQKLKKHVPIETVEVPFIPVVPAERDRVDEIAQIIRVHAAAEEG